MPGLTADLEHPFVEHGLRPLRELIESYRFGPRLRERRPRFLHTLENLERRAEELKTPLLILLVGGTGAGKSTLLNALAGEEIAATSAIRPCTSALTAYLHREARPYLERFELGHAAEATHERAELLQKIIVDAPDFDSVETANVGLLRQTLPQADLILCLATAEKYLNRSLLDLLAEFKSGKRFLFVLNRADRGTPDAVRDDWAGELSAAGFASPEILWISAKNAFAQRRGTPPDEAPSADFPRLETIITQELTRRRIQAIKQHNLDEGYRDLLEAVDASLGPDLARGLESWSQAAELEWRSFRDEVRRRFSLDLETDYALRYKMEYRLAARYTSLFGLFLLASNSLRALLSPLRPRPWRRESMVFSFGAEKLSLAYDQEGFVARLDLLLRKIADLGRERSLDKDACRLELEEHFATDTYRTLKGKVEERLVKELMHLVEARGDRSHKLWNAIYNGVPLTVAGVALGRWVWKVLFGDGEGRLETFLAVAIVVLVILFVERFFAERGAQKKVHAFLTRVRDLVSEAVDAALGDALKSQVGDRVAEARIGLEQLAALKAGRSALLAEIHDDTQDLGITATRADASATEEP